jgi:hypothetical protein
VDRTFIRDLEQSGTLFRRQGTSQMNVTLNPVE